MGYSTKLDTNGTRPLAVKGLIAQGLVDYIAMDIKAPFTKYAQVCGPLWIQKILPNRLHYWKIPGLITIFA